MKPRTFIAKKNLYFYFNEECWLEDNPTEYGKGYGVAAKDVRGELLEYTIYKGTRLTLVENDSGMYTWCHCGLADKAGDIVFYLRSEQDIPLNWFKEEQR